jgi:hypothetical protein
MLLSFVQNVVFTLAGFFLGGNNLSFTAHLWITWSEVSKVERAGENGGLGRSAECPLLARSFPLGQKHHWREMW